MTIKEPDYTGLCSFEGLIGAQLPIQVISIHQTALFAGPVYGLQDFEESLERTGYDINYVYPQWNSLQTQTPF